MSKIYQTEIEIWAGFGPVVSTEKNWAYYEQLFVMFSGGKKIIIFRKKCCSNEKLHYISVI